MIFSITVLSAPSDSAAPARALAFAEAALAAGHGIERVFFYGTGAQCARDTATDPAPVPGGASDWVALARRAGCALAVCSKSARHHAGTELAESFQLCGLGDLVAAALAAERSLVFSG